MLGFCHCSLFSLHSQGGSAHCRLSSGQCQVCSKHLGQDTQVIGQGCNSQPVGPLLPQSLCTPSIQQHWVLCCAFTPACRLRSGAQVDWAPRFSFSGQALAHGCCTLFPSPPLSPGPDELWTFSYWVVMRSKAWEMQRKASHSTLCLWGCTMVST